MSSIINKTSGGLSKVSYHSTPLKKIEASKYFTNVSIIAPQEIIQYGARTESDSELHTTVRQNNYLRLKSLIQIFTQSNSVHLHLNALNTEGFTPFTLAVLLNFQACVELFLQYTPAVDVNFRFPKIGSTALIEAIREDKNNTARMLLQMEETDLNKEDLHTGLTPLIAAFSRQNIEVSRILLQNKMLLINKHTYRVPINENEDDFYFPSLIAIYHSFEFGINLLARRPDFNPNEKTEKQGISAIYFALSKNKMSIFNLLLELKETNCLQIKMDINIQTTVGLTPLHYAAQHGLSGIAARILTYPDTNANITTHAAKFTPFHLAVINGKNATVVVFLSSFKVDLFFSDKNGYSVFMIAKRQRQKLIRNTLMQHFESHYVVDFEEINMETIRTLLNHEPILISNLELFEGLNLLKKILEIKSHITFLQFNKAGILYSDNNTKKVCLGRFTKNSIIIDFYDFDFFSQYILSYNLCPITKMPLSSSIDFEDVENFDKKCYILPAELIASLEQDLK